MMSFHFIVDAGIIECFAEGGKNSAMTRGGMLSVAGKVRIMRTF